MRRFLFTLFNFYQSITHHIAHLNEATLPIYLPLPSSTKQPSLLLTKTCSFLIQAGLQRNNRLHPSDASHSGQAGRFRPVRHGLVPAKQDHRLSPSPYPLRSYTHNGPLSDRAAQSDPAPAQLVSQSTPVWLPTAAGPATMAPLFLSG